MKDLMNTTLEKFNVELSKQPKLKYKKQEYIDEIVLFLNRFDKHYDNKPSELQYTIEFDHFLKSILK